MYPLNSNLLKLIMNTKTCLYCGKTYEAKRSDAVFCSESCRTKSNYQKRKKQNNFTDTLSNAVPSVRDEDEPDCEIKVTGSVSFESLKENIEKYEQEYKQLISKTNHLLHENFSLIGQINQLEKQISAIQTSQIEKLTLTRQLSDVELYNTYLNKPYMEAKQAGEKYLKHKLITETEMRFHSNNEIRIQIGKFRFNIETKVLSHQSDIESLKHQIRGLQSVIDLNKEQLKVLTNQVRFCQNRIIKYEALLT